MKTKQIESCREITDFKGSYDIVELIETQTESDRKTKTLNFTKNKLVTHSDR